MTEVVPENGYESPSPDTEVEFSGSATLSHGRRRKAIVRGSIDDKDLEAERQDAHMQSNGTNQVQQDADRGIRLRRVGIRDRVCCYTWTWFTMTMATGGIANVLHSSLETFPSIPKCIAGLTLDSPIPV